ncbi:hypothetical protein BC443_16725 [Salinicola sp. MIT1003]|nr:hypothetical protein BC443_16725 [Salinicola sp. MIT1003]
MFHIISCFHEGVAHAWTNSMLNFDGAGMKYRVRKFIEVACMIPMQMGDNNSIYFMRLNTDAA